MLGTVHLGRLISVIFTLPLIWTGVTLVTLYVKRLCRMVRVSAENITYKQMKK